MAEADQAEAPQAIADRLGISSEAAELSRAIELIDLHLDTFIPHRLWGYDLEKRHGGAPFFGRLYHQLDLPRAADGGLTGGIWSITTQPFRSKAGRWRAFLKNVERLGGLLRRAEGVAVVRNFREHEAARAAGKHSAFLGIQGGHALEGAPDGPASIPDRSIVRVTLVHLTSSCYGVTSSPAAALRSADPGLTDLGKSFVEALNGERIFVDLAHIHPKGFWDAVEVHDKTQPLIVTHTGVSGVTESWRNIDDDQLKAVADTGGTIGIMFHKGFLKHPGGSSSGALVVDHLEHIVNTVGEDFASIGSDYDGNIIPPDDLRSADSYPRLIQHMLDRGFTAERIQKIFSQNFLRALHMLRPE